MMKNIFHCLMFLLVFTFSSCNEYEYTDISIKMINNQNNSWVYMWIESLEDKPTYLQQEQSRTVNLVFTFTKDNPQTTITVICEDRGVLTSTKVIVNSESSQINAYYNSDGRISIL